jgi:hypothetical protein
MSSQIQIQSNRRNSLLSTGPRSEAGKIASSKNAISHGLSAADPVLPYENRDEFNTLVENCSTEFEPQTIHEKYLVSQMAAARWRLDRVQRIENATIDLILLGSDESTDFPDHKIAQRMLDAGGDPLPRLERYRASIERSYHRAVKEFRMAEKYRIQDEARLRRVQRREIEELLHNAMTAPVPGYKERKTATASTETNQD